MLVQTGLTVIEGTAATAQEQVSTLEEVATKVAGRINGADDPEVVAISMDGVRWAIAFSNISNRLRFLAQQSAVLPLVEDVETIALASDFVGVRLVEALMTDANPDYPNDLVAGEDPVHSVIPFEDYARFRMSRPDEKCDGPPIAWSARNTFSDRKILLRQRPSSTAVANWQVRVHYEAPITLPEKGSDVIRAPKDFQIVLEEGAKYYLLFERQGDDPVAYRHQWNVFNQLLGKYNLHDQKRNASEVALIRIGGPV